LQNENLKLPKIDIEVSTTGRAAFNLQFAFFNFHFAMLLVVLLLASQRSLDPFATAPGTDTGLKKQK